MQLPAPTHPCLPASVKEKLEKNEQPSRNENRCHSCRRIRETAPVSCRPAHVGLPAEIPAQLPSPASRPLPPKLAHRRRTCSATACSDARSLLVSLTSHTPNPTRSSAAFTNSPSRCVLVRRAPGCVYA